MKLQIHHIEMCVSDPDRILGILRDQFGFVVVGTRNTKICDQTVVQAGKKIFVITHRKNQDIFAQTSVEPWTTFCCDDRQNKSQVHVDSVFNIAIQLKNLDKVLEHLKKTGCVILRDLSTVSSPDGSVKYAIIKSCCGNIVHTLIEKTNYHGRFLPEFNNIGNDNIVEESESHSLGVTSHFDHVSLACRAGDTDKLIAWYAKAFEMRRFITNREDSENEGLVIRGEVGMRLKVMEFWACSEIGLSSDLCTEKDDWEPLKMVIVESLPDTSNTQIDMFIRDHGGPGLQHIGLYSPNIFETVEKMAANGVQFRRPPPAYYTQVGQLKAITDVGADLVMLQKCGILLDSEADVFDDSTEEKYLMQVFTHPIFDLDTFFLEVIQRKGALGFGVGNVTALARSINAYTISK